MKQRDPRYKVLWRLLSHALHASDPSKYASSGITVVDADACEVELKVSWIAKRLDVSRNSISAWLNQFESNDLISFQNRYGGRGRGVVIKMNWHLHGKSLAEKRKEALEYKREKHERKIKNLKSAQQRQTSFKHPSGDVIKHRACRDTRLILTTQLRRSQWKQHAIKAVCKWVWLPTTTSTAIAQLLRLVKQSRSLSVPKWVTTPQDAHRWMMGRINNLLAEGQLWLEKFELSYDLKTFPKVVLSIEAAAERRQACPVCDEIHTQWEYDTGMSEEGGLSCLGWARERMADFRDLRWSFEKEARATPDPYPSASKTAWEEFHEQKAADDAFKAKQAEMAREKLGDLRVVWN